MRLHLQLCYQGTHYHGWQIQNPTHALQTIQGCVERAFLRLTGKHLRITGAGRTDSGVHALCQHAHCDLPPGIIRRWREGLNAYLPEDIRIISAEPCAPTFHARFDAIDKTYFYSFWTETAFVPPQRAKYVWPSSNASASPTLLPGHTLPWLANPKSHARSADHPR
ncbi:MAG: tRNA pseudouridine(38-40) synthase TruA, partial [Desulfovibrio sp.]|nr:tRNA pseudouridine(38-40) synthase TruA [Desulfovibrio sp.]